MVHFAKKIFAVIFIFSMMVFLPFIINDLNFTYLAEPRRTYVEVFLEFTLLFFLVYEGIVRS